MKTETKSTVLLKHHLKALRLPTVLAECEKVAKQSAADNVDHLGFLLQLLELELIERDRKAAERRLKAARFPAPKTLDEFDFAARPSVNKPQLLDLVRGDYLTKRENILLVGPSGTGKSHLATALGMAACVQGKRVRFWRVTELMTTLREADQERQLLRLRSHLTKLDLLILDELGYVPASKAGAELLFDVIATIASELISEASPVPPLRTQQHRAHHQPRFRALDRSAGQRTAHRSRTRSSHSPLHDY